MHVGEIDTPAILIDIAVMERNLEKVARYARDHGLRLRPHTKTHKIPELGRRQLELGAVGLTVAKTTEALVMLEADPPDLLLAYPVCGVQKARRAAEIARQTKLTVSLDNVDVATELSVAADAAGVSIDILAEVDVGLGRVGVSPGPELVALLQSIDRLPCVRLAGLACYPGHIKALEPNAERELARVDAILAEALSLAREHGWELPIVSGGSTPALFLSHCVRNMNEIRPGTYIFNDRNTSLMGACSTDECAATVLTTVVSTSVPGRVIIDGGSKTFSSDRCVVESAAGFGQIEDAPDVLFEKMNEEHGFLKVEGQHRWRVGDRIRVLPNHICTAMNLHEKVYGVEGETVVEVWDVKGRGKLQ